MSRRVLIIILICLAIAGTLMIGFGSKPKISSLTPTPLPQISLESAQPTKSLSLEQKVGQLFIIGFEGKTATPELKDIIKKIHPGGLLLLGRNIANKKQLKNLIQDLQKVAQQDVGLPLLIAVDQEGGPICRISWLDCTPQFKIKKKQQAFKVGFNRGQALNQLGVNLNLAPVLDESSSGDFIHPRTFKQDLEKVGDLAELLVSGQKIAGILTSIKHFPGYGGIDFNPETEQLPSFSEVPEISQFKKAMEAGPELVMVANALYLKIDSDQPFSLSSTGIDFLKQKLGKDVVIISDDLSSPVLKKKFGLDKTVVSAHQAGVDILLVAGLKEPSDPVQAYNTLLNKAKSEEFLPSINKAAQKVIKLKQSLK